MLIKRSTFNLSGLHLSTYKMGQFVPITYRPIYPGDSVFARSSHFVRLLGLNTPVVHPVYLRAYWFWVSLASVWPNFREWISGSDYENPHVLPTLTFDSSTMGAGSIYDKMGMAITADANTKINAFLSRSYALIWNTYIRDEDLQTELAISTADGPDSTTNFALQNVCWEKDDFTASRPWVQKGPQVYLPLGTSAPIVDAGGGSTTNIFQPKFYDATGTALSSAHHLANAGDATLAVVTATDSSAKTPASMSLKADLSSSNQLTIPEVRFASALQRAEENRARYGDRYPEYMQAEFGIAPYPTEYNYPVYLGGGRRTIQFSEVLGTVNNSDTHIGQYGGHASGLMSSRPVKFFAREHGLLILCVAMQPGTIYNQGYPRDLLISDRNEYIQPELVGVGAQEVLTQEIDASATPGTVFGYNDRYYYARHGYNTSGGDFRSTLNTWTMTRDFATTPSLNADFVSSNPTERIFNGTTYDQVVSATYAYIKVRRVLPKVAPHVLQ